MVTYGNYVGQIGVASPPLLTGNRQYLVFGAPTGITASGAVAPGLSVTAIGAATVEPKTLLYNSPGFAEIVVDPGPLPPSTQTALPVALVVTLPNDMYVLPYAFSVVPTPPPSISGASGTTDAFGNTTVTLAGTNLNASTTILFDGATAPLQSVNSDGSLTVAAPPAAAGYTAYVEALSNVGQTSWQGLGTTALPPSYTYSGPQSPSTAAAVANAVIVNYGLLLPGATSMLDIIGVNTLFEPGQVSIGLASSDITVGQIWVYSSTRVLANVTVNPGAQPGPVDLTVSSGLQLIVVPVALQVQVANPNQMSVQTPILNQATGMAGTPAGGLAVFSSGGFPQNLTGWSATLDYKFSSTVQMEASNQVYMPIPAGVPSGAAIVALNPPNSNVVIPAVVMQVDAPDPVIVAAVNSSGNPISQSNPVRIGDAVTPYR